MKNNFSRVRYNYELNTDKSTCPLFKILLGETFALSRACLALYYENVLDWKSTFDCGNDSKLCAGFEQKYHKTMVF